MESTMATGISTVVQIVCQTCDTLETIEIPERDIHSAFMEGVAIGITQGTEGDIIDGEYICEHCIE